jgi:Arc/MetJ family transcription regulator
VVDLTGRREIRTIEAAPSHNGGLILESKWSTIGIMKTTIDIPDELLKRVMKYSGASTKRDAVLAALTEFNRWHRLEKARRLLGTFKNMMTVEELRELRNRGGRRRGAA